MRSPYGHPGNGSTSGAATIYEIHEAPAYVVDFYAASNLTLTGGSTTLDGATLTEGKLIAAFNQSTGTEDGVLVVDSVSGSTCNLVRAAGFKAGDKLPPGARFYIKSGSSYGGSVIETTGTAVKVLGTDAITPRVVVSLWDSIPVSLYNLREVNATGDVANIAGNGGILASDTTPIMRGDAANSAEVVWVTGDVDPIGFQISLPTTADGTVAAYLDLEVYSGTTNAATMGVASSWNGAAEVTDSADDASTKSATAHTITATIAAADIPDAPTRVTFRITPPTHATDAIGLVGARLRFKRTGFPVATGS